MEASDDEETKAYKRKLHELIPIGKRNYSFSQVRYYKQKFKQDEQKFYEMDEIKN